MLLICALWASELLVDRDLGIIYSPANILMVEEPVKVTVAIKYDLGDAAAVLNQRCPQLNVPYNEMEKRVLAGASAFNGIVGKRYPGFKYVTGARSQAHYEQETKNDVSLSRSELLISAGTPSQVRSRLSQCSRKDTTCLFEPTIRSKRIGYENLASETTFALLPCQLAEEGQASSKCDTLAPYSICCDKSAVNSGCGLEQNLAPARALVKNWLNQNPRGRVLWQSRVDSRVTKINPNRMGFCFSATMAYQAGKTVFFGEPVLEDLGRAWQSTYFLDDSDDAIALTESQASAFTSQLWSILPEPSLPGLPSLKFPSRKNKQKQAQAKAQVKATGSVSTNNNGRITSGTLDVAKLGDKSHSNFAARYYNKYKDNFTGVMRAADAVGLSSRRKGRKGRRHKRELNSLEYVKAADRERPGYWGVETRKLLAQSTPVRKWTHEARCANITYEALMKEVPNQISGQVDVVGILSGTSSVTEEFLSAIDRAGHELFKRGCKGYPPSYLSRNLQELLYRLNSQPIPPNWLRDIQTVRRRRETTKPPTNEKIDKQEPELNGTVNATEITTPKLLTSAASAMSAPMVADSLETYLVQNDHDKSLRFMLMNKRTLPPSDLVHDPDDSFLTGSAVLQFNAEMGSLHIELCESGATADSIGQTLLKRLSKIEDRIHHLQEELQRNEVPGDVPVTILQAVCAHHSDADECDSEVLMQSLTKATVSGAFLLDHALNILLELDIQIPVTQDHYQVMKIDTIPHFAREPGNGTDRFRAVQVVNLPPVIIMDLHYIELYATHLEGCVEAETQMICEKDRFLTNLNTRGTLCAKAVYLGLDDEISNNCRREMVTSAVTDFSCLAKQVSGGIIISVESTKSLEMELVSQGQVPVSATDTCTGKICVVPSTVEAHFSCGSVEVKSAMNQVEVPIKLMDSGLDIEGLIDQKLSEEILGRFTTHQYAGANTTFLITFGFGAIVVLRLIIHTLRKLFGAHVRRLCLIAKWNNGKRRAGKMFEHRAARATPTAQQLQLSFLRSISPSNSGSIYSQ